MYCPAIRKIFDPQFALTAGDDINKAFAAAERAGYIALTFNGKIYINGKPGLGPRGWFLTCFSLEDFQG